jgi:hypothetical protein
MIRACRIDLTRDAKEEAEADVIWADDLRQLISTFPAFGVRLYRSLAIILGRRLRQTSKELLREMTKKTVAN